MRNSAKRVMALIVAGIMIVGIVATVFACAASAKTTISQKKDSLSQSQQQKNTIQNQISDIQDQKSETMAKKQQIDQEISALTDSIESLNSKIAAKEDEIAQKEEQIVTLTQQIDAKDEQFRTRVRVMYEQGDTSYLEVILSSKSFSDMFTRIELVREMASHDKELLNELNNNKTQLENTKASLETDKQELESDQNELKSQKEQQEAKSQEAAALMEELSGKQADLEAQEAEIDAEMASIKKEIASLQAASSYSGGSGTPARSGGRLGWPSDSSTRITSEFGMRYHPTLHVYKLHTGMDIGAARGTNVLACEAGTVVKATYSAAYGNYVVINHGNGMSTLYGHNSSLCVSAGQTVTRGQVIAKVGSTGYATGPHIHIEVIINGEYQNPRNYF